MSPENLVGYPSKKRLKDLAVCLSLANLLWLDPWRLALGIRWNPFFFPTGTYVHLITVVLGVLVTAGFLWLGLIGARRHSKFRGVADWVFLLVCAVAANTLRTQIPLLSTPGLLRTLGGPGLLIVTGTGLAAGVWLAIFRRGPLIRVLKVAALILGPFALYTFYEAGDAVLSELQVPPATPSRLLPNPVPGPRVVLVLFDEMDRANVVAGAGRLPALTRLLDEAVDFTAAITPAGARTLISLPTITTGRTVAASDPSGPGNVQIRFTNGQERLWSEPPNFFRISRSEGVDGFLAGWFIPYCRMFAADLSNCSWRPSYPMRPESVAASLRLYAPLFWRSIPGLNRMALLLGWRSNEGPGLAWHMESLQVVHARALEGVRDPRYRLVFLHYPMPHLSSDFRGNLVENQMLADQALGELRAAMEEDGTWDSSAVIVMSDHGHRAFPGVRHPVLLVKPPHVRSGATVGTPVKLERVFHLVLGLLRGKVRTADEVVAVVRAAE